METKMSALLFAKKLRARQTELRAKQAAASKAYAGLFEKWKKDLAVWLAKDAPTICKTITRDMISNHYPRSGEGYRDVIFKGAPRPPRKPSDKAIGRIAVRLRALAITGQKTVSVADREIEELFTDEVEGADDD